MYLTDLTDAQKSYIRGTILMENWRSKNDLFLNNLLNIEDGLSRLSNRDWKRLQPSSYNRLIPQIQCLQIFVMYLKKIIQ